MKHLVIVIAKCYKVFLSLNRIRKFKYIFKNTVLLMVLNEYCTAQNTCCWHQMHR